MPFVACICVHRLIGICGSVGSGKSSLLSTILGQTVIKHGRVGLNGSFAYVSQQAWIFHASVRDNITYGMPWNEAKYNKGSIVTRTRVDLPLKLFLKCDDTNAKVTALRYYDTLHSCSRVIFRLHNNATPDLSKKEKNATLSDNHCNQISKIAQIIFHKATKICFSMEPESTQ